MLQNKAWQSLVPDGWGLSVEEVVSCSNLIVAGGCNGGWADLGYEIVKKQGVMNATNDPWSSGDGTVYPCLPLSPPVTHVTNYTFATPPCLLDCSKQNMPMLAQTVSEYAPVSVCLDASGFDDYTV